MITQRRKSAVRPCLSVSRPSSKTCRKRSQTVCVRPSRTRRAGRPRTARLRTDGDQRRASPSTLESPSSRSRLSGVWNSLMSSRTSRSASRRGTPLSAFAISVLPVPGGADEEEDGERPASGRSGPALTSATRSTRQSTASGWPSTRLLEERAHVVEVGAASADRARAAAAPTRRERRDHGLRRHLGREPARDALEQRAPAGAAGSPARPFPAGSASPGRATRRACRRRRRRRRRSRPVARDRERVLIRHRCQPDHLEEPRHALPLWASSS